MWGCPPILNILPGFPTTTALSGISFITLVPIPIYTLLPILHPFIIVLPGPIHTSSPTVTEPEKVTPAAIAHLLPILSLCAIWQWWSILVPSPMIVSLTVPLSTLVPAQISTLSPMITPPICGICSHSPFSFLAAPNPSVPIVQFSCIVTFFPTLTHSGIWTVGWMNAFVRSGYFFLCSLANSNLVILSPHILLHI